MIHQIPAPATCSNKKVQFSFKRSDPKPGEEDEDYCGC